MKALLIAPTVRPALTLLGEDRPLVTFPILGECLLNHWVEHLAALGAKQVVILASDRPDEVALAVGDGERWGVQIEVIATANELSVTEATSLYQAGSKTGWLAAPYDITVMSHLPGAPEYRVFDSYAAWFAGVVTWMPRSLTPARMRVMEIRPGIWVGRRSRIAKTAQLVAPCWIGDQVMIGPNAVIGPGAVVENRAVIEAGTRVEQSYVGADTFVGRMISVMNSFAVGSTLVNWQTESSLRVPDPFLLCSLAPSRRLAPGVLARLRSALFRLVTAPYYVFTTGWARPAHK
jgi:NDP-sugar pyrophosphorylase family protein